MQRIQVKRRHFGFKAGELVVAVKEYKTPQCPARPLSFAIAVSTQLDRRILWEEILKRIVE